MATLVTRKQKDIEMDQRLAEIRNRVVEPMTASMAARIHRLNLYEKGEILDYRQVYFCGRPDAKKSDMRRFGGSTAATGKFHNYGFDDDKGNYEVFAGDHIAYRYRILGVLGKGSFGKVVKCLDHKTGKLVAVKMIISRKKFHMQGLVEADILRSLRQWDASDTAHVIRYVEHFTFRDHLCISTEILGVNLYELIKLNEYRGLPLRLVRHLTRQMLQALEFLERYSIIHCDIKPENVLLCDAERGLVKLIDFGSSCFESQRTFTYIQSRYYRSPEIILGMPYGMPIDMWSVACIVPELLTGSPIFTGENEKEQMACIQEVIGLPDSKLVSRCARRNLFFTGQCQPLPVLRRDKTPYRPGIRPLPRVLRTDFPPLVRFLEAAFVWNPRDRIRPTDALAHEFMTMSPDLL